MSTACFLMVCTIAGLVRLHAIGTAATPVISLPLRMLAFVNTFWLVAGATVIGAVVGATVVGLIGELPQSFWWVVLAGLILGVSPFATRLVLRVVFPGGVVDATPAVLEASILGNAVSVALAIIVAKAVTGLGINQAIEVGLCAAWWNVVVNFDGVRFPVHTVGVWFDGWLGSAVGVAFISLAMLWSVAALRWIVRKVSRKADNGVHVQEDTAPRGVVLVACIVGLVAVAVAVASTRAPYRGDAVSNPATMLHLIPWITFHVLALGIAVAIPVVGIAMSRSCSQALWRVSDVLVLACVVGWFTCVAPRIVPLVSANALYAHAPASFWNNALGLAVAGVCSYLVLWRVYRIAAMSAAVLSIVFAFWLLVNSDWVLRSMKVALASGAAGIGEGMAVALAQVVVTGIILMVVYLSRQWLSGAP